MIAIGIFLAFVITMLILGLKCTPIPWDACIKGGIHKWKKAKSGGWNCKKCGFHVPPDVDGFEKVI